MAHTPPDPLVGAHFFTIPLGVTDVIISIRADGAACLESPAPLPRALEEVVDAVLETWMIDPELHQTMIPYGPWLTYFGHRLTPVPA